jgi:hypothetical protein
MRADDPRPDWGRSRTVLLFLGAAFAVPALRLLRMGRRPIPSDQIPSHPVRRAVLEHLVACGGNASAVETCARVGIRFRASLRNHALILQRGEFITVRKTGRGSQRVATLFITPKGSSVLAGDLNPQALELSS